MVRDKIDITGYAHGGFIGYKIAEYEKGQGDAYVVRAYRVRRL